MKGITNARRLPIAITAALLAVTPVAAQDSGASSIESDRSTESPAPPSDVLDSDGTFTGPDAVENLLRQDAEEKRNILDTNLLESWDKLKADLKELIGLDFGLDYNALGFLATESLGDDGSASGVARFFGRWDLFEREGPNTGSFIFKIEHRHGYTNVPVSDFGFEIGYAGFVNPLFSNQGFRTTHLFWRQSLFDEKVLSYVGFLDVSDFTNIYALASPWLHFSNLAFSIGSGTIGGLPDGALGAMVGGFLSDHVYAVGSLVDANADPTAPFDGFDTFFNEFETFKTLELGWTAARELMFVDNAHVTFWQIDARQAAGTPSGWGVVFSISDRVAESWLLFLRGGWADDGGSLYDGSVSLGFGHQLPSDGLLGLGLNWSSPNENTFGTKLDDQFTGELFLRVQLTQNGQITPSVQLLGNPALNPSEDFIAVFGVRARLAF